MCDARNDAQETKAWLKKIVYQLTRKIQRQVHNSPLGGFTWVSST